MATDRTGQTFATIFPALVQIDGNELADTEGTLVLNVNTPTFAGLLTAQGGATFINSAGRAQPIIKGAGNNFEYAGLKFANTVNDESWEVLYEEAGDLFIRFVDPGVTIQEAIHINQSTGNVGIRKSPTVALDVSGDLTISGTLSKGSGTFLIDHPLNLSDKDLYHGFVEAPRYDLIYRGKVNLTNGTAEVDIDSASDMTAGTFEALTKNATVTSLQNQDGFSRVKPTGIVDGKFTIECEDSVNDEIAWVVIAERNDDYIRNGDPRTDDTGSLITEWDKEAPVEVQLTDRKTTAIKNNKGKKGYPRHPKAHGINEDELFSDEDEYQQTLDP